MLEERADALLALARALLPASASVAVMATGAELPPLRGAEAASIGTMRESRLREFTAGRACARHALRALGYPSVAVPVQDGRAPAWPSGACGSISHTSELAAAAVAPCTRVRSLGIDIEPAAPLDPDLHHRILRADERHFIAGRKDPERTAMLFFSAKESAYKCLWPLTRGFVDFPELEIGLLPGEGRFQVHSRSSNVPAAMAGAIRGRFGIAAGHVLTIAWIRPPFRERGRVSRQEFEAVRGEPVSGAEPP